MPDAQFVIASETGGVFYFVFMAIVLIVVVAIVVFLAGLPGRIARRRGHPSADAISICSWIGLLFWPCWFVAIIWAHTSTKG